MKRKVLVILVVLALAAGTASAQFGFGGIVYDPTNYHNALLRYFQLQQQLIQLRNSYAQLVAQYNFALWMAKTSRTCPPATGLSSRNGETPPRRMSMATREPG